MNLIICFLESEWAQWSSFSWSICDQPCGTGIRFKERKCQKGKGKSTDKHTRLDSTRPPPEAIERELEKPSDDTKEFHQSLCNQVPAQAIVDGT